MLRVARFVLSSCAASVRKHDSADADFDRIFSRIKDFADVDDRPRIPVVPRATTTDDEGASFCSHSDRMAATLDSVLDSAAGIMFARFSWFSVSNTWSRFSVRFASGAITLVFIQALVPARFIGERLKLTAEPSPEFSVGIKTKLSIGLSHAGVSIWT
jgi:hypothetical protein